MEGLQSGVEPGGAANRPYHRARLRGDQRAAAGPPPAPPPRAAPAQLPAEAAGFVGRADQLTTLDKLGEERLVAVVGTAGVGKTALVLHWAHRHREQFPDGQLYVDLCGFSTTPPLRPVDVLARFLRDLGMPPAEVPTDPAEAAARYRSLLADRRVLVVLDNAAGAEQVRPLLPGGQGCLAVVTSRDRLDSLSAYEGAARLRLEPLPAAESQALLAHVLGAERLAAEPEAARDLARLCADLPLALRIAAASLAGRSGGLAAYVARLREHGLDGHALLDEPQAAVRTTFDLSYAALAEQTQSLFRLLGCVPGVSVTAESAATLAGFDRATADRLLDRLAAAHLLAETAPGRFGCHDLLRDYAVGLAEAVPAAERDVAAWRLIVWYTAMAEAATDLVYPDRLRLPGHPERSPDPPPGWQRPDQAVAWLAAERHNLVLVAQHAAEHGPPEAWRLAICLPYFLSQRGHLSELLAVCRAAKAAADATGDPIGLAAAHLALGTTQYIRRDYHAASEHFLTAAEPAEAAGWLEGRAVALRGLGNAYQGAGRRAEAAASYTEALELQQRLGLGPARAGTLVAVGNTRWELGQLEDAVDHYTQAVALHRATGHRSMRLGVALANLGNVLIDLGRPEESLGPLTEALEIHQGLGNRLSEGNTLRGLAAAYRDIGTLTQAAELAETALRLARDTGHRGLVAAALNTAATIRRVTGPPEAAVAGHLEALGLVGGHTFLAAEIQLDLATTYQRLGEPELASSHAAEARAIARDNDYRLLAHWADEVLAATDPGRSADPALAGQPAPYGKVWTWRGASSGSGGGWLWW
jgi:tetratricopeptide (TPR) repeat protein